MKKRFEDMSFEELDEFIKTQRQKQIKENN